MKRVLIVGLMVAGIIGATFVVALNWDNKTITVNADELIATEETEDSLAEQLETKGHFAADKITDDEIHKKIKEMVKSGELDPYDVTVNSSDFDAEEQLTVGGFNEPVFYTSNFELFNAHSIIATLLVETDFEKHKDSALDGLLGFLQKIKYDKVEEEQQKKMDKVIELTKVAAKNDIKQTNPILSEIHSLLHELDEHFNIDPYAHEDN